MSELSQNTGHVNPDDDGIPLALLAASLIRSRYLILIFGMGLGLASGLLALSTDRTYTSQFLFMPDGTDAGPSGLSALAGQFGVRVPGGEVTSSPQFYTELLRTGSLLGRLAADTFSSHISEDEPVSGRLDQLLRMQAEGEARRQRAVVQWLRGAVTSSIVREAGLVRVSVTTPWPNVSHDIARSIVELLNEFDLQTRRTRAGVERRYLEARLEEAEEALAVTERNLQSFLERNRQFQNSPELSFQMERLERRLVSDQQRVLSLRDALYEARLSEVRDTPAITVVDGPEFPVIPNSRRVAYRTMIALLFGAILGAFAGLARDLIAHSSKRRSPGTGELARAWREAAHDVRFIRRSRRRSRSDHKAEGA